MSPRPASTNLIINVLSGWHPGGSGVEKWAGRGGCIADRLGQRARLHRAGNERFQVKSPMAATREHSRAVCHGQIAFGCVQPSRLRTGWMKRNLRGEMLANRERLISVAQVAMGPATK